MSGGPAGVPGTRGGSPLSSDFRAARTGGAGLVQGPPHLRGQGGRGKSRPPFKTGVWPERRPAADDPENTTVLAGLRTLCPPLENTPVGESRRKQENSSLLDIITCHTANDSLMTSRIFLCHGQPSHESLNTESYDPCYTAPNPNPLQFQQAFAR